MMSGLEFKVSTHSRPKAAVDRITRLPPREAVSTHSRPKAAVPFVVGFIFFNWFQHTAARRRLGWNVTNLQKNTSFNTQPPEGG